ncbi:MAG: PQQ-binding-like beta-propeller repeat protein [Acidobacteria bacterium]|nr:PQQ-binding-like beta-propeller repeat protein [Acidobacteriota bacterium]MYI95835.1 PQQ-binding-like beta-propeller repeat protein [Acidobacteriota bacterium]
MRPSSGKTGFTWPLFRGAPCLAALSLLSVGAALAHERPPGVPSVSTDLGQPPEQPPEQPPAEPPEQPPAEPPGELDEAEAPQAPAGEVPPTGEAPGEGTPTEETAGEAGDGEPGEAESGEPGDEEAEPARRPPEVVTAPVGILPGRLVATPAPVPGGSIIGMVLGAEGFLLQTAGGDVVAYEPDGERTRWGVSGAGAAFVAEDAGTVVLLDENGDVALRRIADGVRTGGFSTGFAPDPAIPAPAVRRPAPAAFEAGVLYWVSSGTLRGYRVPGGSLVLEGALPEGQAANVVVAPAPADSAAGVPPLLLVSLGSGGVAAVAASQGTTSGTVRWQAAGAGPVTGPVLPFPAERLAFFGDEGGDLTAVDLESGRERWRWELAEGFHHPPLLSRGRLYAATKANSLYCFDAKRGGQRWRAALPGRPAAAPLRIAGAILVVTRDGLLVEVNAETGARIGRPRDLDAEVLGVVRRLGDGAREDGWRDRRLFLGLRDGRLAVFGPRIGGETP